MSFNVYVLDSDPVLAAQALDDHRLLAAPGIVEIILESAAAMRKAVAAGRPIPRGTQHPRHLITRHAARSIFYVNWLTEHAVAALQEAEWRGLRDHEKAYGDAEHIVRFAAKVTALEPVDPVSRIVLDGYMQVIAERDVRDLPQRLDGAEDLCIDGNPVRAYRTWFAEAKVPGGPRAWAGTDVGWTRRAPEWLVGLGVEVSEVPWCGLGEKPAWPVWTARWVGGDDET